MEKKNYITANYSVSIEVAKFPGDVFNHLIDLKKWWPEDFDGDEIKLNSEFVFTTGDSHYSKNKVIEFVPNKKITWLTLEAIRKTDNYSWTGTKMIFELTPQNNNTLIKFTYDGVVFEDEYERLVKICDMTLKEMFYNFIMNGKGE
jgi:Activator of Hsp90 ATPase homolog 1-like protein